jgi:hypothetical protein
MSVHKVDVKTGETGIAPNGKPYVLLSYYMKSLDAQKDWKKVPGAILGETPEEAMNKAKIISSQLNGLTVFEMNAKVRAFIEAGDIVAHVRHLE